MVDDHDLEGLDPYDLMAAEGARIDAFMSGLGEADWKKQSRCAGWSVRDLLAHLASSEDYNRACLDGTVQQFLAEMGEKGATDLAKANDIGIHELDGKSTEELLAVWRADAAKNREDFRARDGRDVDSSVGEYPARWQAFHLAFELAVHADDISVPVPAADAASRNAWQARVGRFALRELKPELVIESRNGRTRVHADDLDVDLTDELFVRAVAARLPEQSGLDNATAAVLSATP
jgi:uncharacterized protein (TIGR03083 family)